MGFDSIETNLVCSYMGSNAAALKAFIVLGLTSMCRVQASIHRHAKTRDPRNPRSQKGAVSCFDITAGLPDQYEIRTNFCIA